jgi:peptidoglycan-associated lipoprotein
MRHWTKALLLVAATSLAACSTGADRFGAGSGDVAGGPGALGSAADPTSVAYFQEAVGDRILFVVDTSTLTPEAQGILQGQARFMMENGDYTAIIEGHADERGTREYNLALGARRASALQDFLVSQGVASNRLRTVTYGKERPLEICSEEACYAQNRRAVTVLGAGGLGS